MANTTILTKEGYDKLWAEYRELVDVKRGEASEKIKVAREYGDLSENAEYDAAKEEQAMIEARIKVLESQLSNYEIIDNSKISNDVVSIGSFVKVLDMEFEEEEVYQIVGSTEADINVNRISNNSPMATALLGKKKGDVARVSTPQATFEVKILLVSKDKID
ncbi:MAG: transcription elongation factor GreA [Clostridia bacterium]|nr:transcription elongation factor GreA [Clostridia bacterium]